LCHDNIASARSQPLSVRIQHVTSPNSESIRDEVFPCHSSLLSDFCGIFIPSSHYFRHNLPLWQRHIPQSGAQWHQTGPLDRTCCGVSTSAFMTSCEQQTELGLLETPSRFIWPEYSRDISMMVANHFTFMLRRPVLFFVLFDDCMSGGKVLKFFLLNLFSCLR
jgi:hypothetical protein